MTITTWPDALTREDGSPVRALVVDDEPSLADLLTLALRYEGWRVAQALTGEAAVRLAEEVDPDIVLLDVMLPDTTGLEVLARLRASRPRLPVLFLTARDSAEDRTAGLAAGADDYVTKPFSLRDVVARLRELLRRSRAAGERPDQRPSSGISVTHRDDETRVRLVGAIDSALRQQASESMGLVLIGRVPVVLDASETTFVDSAGAAFVIQLVHATQEAGVDLSLHDPAGVLRRTLELVGLADLLTTADSSPSDSSPGRPPQPTATRWCSETPGGA